MKRRFTLLATVFGSIALFFNQGCSTQAKQPVLKHSKWVCEKEMFVADAGMATETFTIEFTSATECSYTMSWYMPAHPAMYVNRDGSIDTIPASESEHVTKGTWTFRRSKLTITFEDGTTKAFDYKDGKLVSAEKYIDNTYLVFEIKT